MLTVEGVTGLFGISFLLRYTGTEHVDVLSAGKGDMPGDDVIMLDPVIDDANGTVSIGLTRKRPATGLNGNGVVAKVTLKSDSDTPDGTSVTLSITGGGVRLRYDPGVLRAVDVTPTLTLNRAYWEANTDLNGEVRFAVWQRETHVAKARRRRQPALGGRVRRATRQRGTGIAALSGVRRTARSAARPDAQRFSDGLANADATPSELSQPVPPDVSYEAFSSNRLLQDGLVRQHSNEPSGRGPHESFGDGSSCLPV